ncbi:MAG: DNA translocase FtsK [Anaerolineaceae bacterium]|jgi:S-DNA-T family DNA segregation ATPase FtsK/SpoIIIE
MSAEKKSPRSATATNQKKPSSNKGVNPRNKQHKAAQKAGEQENNLLPALVDSARSGLQNLKRFGWDLLGTFLALVAVLTLLGLLGLSRGTLMDSWIQFLKQSFGYGRYLIVVILGLLSAIVFRQGAGKPLQLSFARVMAIEGLFITIFPLLAGFGGVSIDRAAEGKDGGLFGWGLAQLFVPVITRTGALLFYLAAFVLLLAYISHVRFWLVDGHWKELFGKIIALPKQKAEQKTIGTLPKQSSRLTASAARRIPAAVSGEEHPISVEPVREHRLPPLSLLLDDKPTPLNDSVVKNQAKLIEQKLAEFGVPVKVIGYRVGPTVTQYAVEPGYTERIGADGKLIRQKVKVSKISSLARDLALALSAQRLRVETPVPGKSYVGIEVPNEDNAFVRLKPILASDAFKAGRSPLDIALGRDVSGEPVMTDLERLPHLLIAGTTNSGKSVCVTSLTTSLVMNNSPADLRLVMLDPKMVELMRFNGLPHLMGKVETELERMLAVLRWAQMEMDARYRLLAEVRARNLAGYNLKMRQKKKPPLPRIVIIIDELADLMMSAPDQTEHSLIRLAQMARATGIHMVVATQRPSTDVITGLIKANFPARISFAMASSVDSRVILDANGAENLLGRGDMLFLDPAKSGLQRLQGVIVSDSEIEKIQKHWQTVLETVEVRPAPWEDLVEEIGSSDSDALVEQAIGVVRAAGKASTSLLQRRLRIGFPRAARLMDELEEMGVIGPSVGSGKEREVLPDNGADGDNREAED